MTESGKKTAGWIATILLIAVAAAVVAWSLTREGVTVVDRAGETRTLTGPEFVRAAATDRLLRGPNGEFIDLRVPGVVEVEDDCPT
jgi:hypothetical protein